MTTLPLPDTSLHFQHSSAHVPTLRLSKAAQAALQCPVCRSKLFVNNNECICVGEACGARFPIINGIPVLINEQNSIFTIDDFHAQRNTTFDLQPNRLLKWLFDVTPDISNNIKAKKNFAAFVQLLLAQSDHPRVLVVGGSIMGEGFEDVAYHHAIEWIESDVSFGPRTGLICDSHDIPFENGSFDGVIIQAVLEHVVDPRRCVEEIYRVLKPQGVVYAETPFMQQVHMRQYDFTRFTHLGHRRLFRHFDEIESGAVNGPGMALAWAYRYFLLSFTESKVVRQLIGLFVRLTSFYFKFFDYYLLTKPGALDAASGFYFLGRKSDHLLSDHELLGQYRGAM